MLTRHDVDAAAINSALRERQGDLEHQSISEESARYSERSIYVQNAPGPDPSNIYIGDDPMDWMENLAGWLLKRSYPSLPVSTHALPQPVCEDYIGEFFASIFGKTGTDADLLCSLGPELGLSTPESSSCYDPSRCPVFLIIREKISSGLVNFGELHRYLAYEVGLNDGLASLFLTLFVHHEHPEHQIQLEGGASVFMADCGPLLETKLTPDLIPLIAWNRDLAANAMSIGPVTETRFNDIKHHLSVLSPKITFCSEDTTGDVLARVIESVGEHTVEAHQVLIFLETDYNATGEIAELQASPDRLRLVSGGDYTGVYRSIRAAYPSLLHLTGDLETLSQLAALDHDFVEIFEARAYVNNVPSADFPNLAVNRETLLTGLSPSQLIRSRGRGWSAIARDASAFKTRYAQAYRENHQLFHDVLPEFQATLSKAKKKSAALGLLNTIIEFGSPEGTALDEKLAALAVGPVPWSQQASGLDLSNEPHCPECQISLAQSVSATELARLAPQVDMALGGKNQELSKRFVEKALANRAHEHWQEFLQIVQASELTSLANTLDNNLVSFIRQVLD